MTDDLNLHVEAIRALFKKRFSGGIEGFPGEFSPDIFKGKDDINAEDRVKILRLIENMTLGRNAVAYLTESMHGAGSPQAQRVQISRKVDIEQKKDFAKKLSGVKERD